MAKDKKRKFRYNFASADLVIFLWQKRKPLAIIASAAFFVSLMVSLSITPLFKASVIMFPTTGASVSKSILSEGYSGRYNIYEIGEESHAENLLQVLYSDEIRDRIIEKYDLMGHHNIKPSSKFPKTKINSIYNSNIRFKRTPYMSVMVEVMDKDPQMAADIANDIASLADSVFHRMIRERTFEAFKLVEKEYLILVENMNELQDSLTKIRKLGINHYETQAERYYEAYAKAINENNTRAAAILSDKIRVLSEYGGQYVALRDQLVHETSRLSRIKQKYAEARVEMEQSLPYSFIVNSAVKPEKKSYPKKSIIVIASVLSALLLGAISLLLIENMQKKLV